MNSPGGAATQICSPQFDRRFFSLPAGTQKHIQRKIDELGCNLRGFSHHRMQGVDAFRVPDAGGRFSIRMELRRRTYAFVTTSLTRMPPGCTTFALMPRR